MQAKGDQSTEQADRQGQQGLGIGRRDNLERDRADVADGSLDVHPAVQGDQESEGRGEGCRELERQAHGTGGAAREKTDHPEHQRAEFFGLWTFAIRLSAIIGPVTYGLITLLSAGNHRLAIFSTGLFFVLGLVLLRAVDVRRGIAVAQEADARVDERADEQDRPTVG
jgi:hypothetical protein